MGPADGSVRIQPVTPFLTACFAFFERTMLAIPDVLFGAWTEQLISIVLPPRLGLDEGEVNTCHFNDVLDHGPSGRHPPWARRCPGVRFWEIISIGRLPEFSYFPVLSGASGYNQSGLQPRKNIANIIPRVHSRLKNQLAQLSCEETRFPLNRVCCILTRLTQPNPPTKPDVLRWLTGKGNP
jgi:hypothetical protein